MTVVFSVNFQTKTYFAFKGACFLKVFEVFLHVCFVFPQSIQSNSIKNFQNFDLPPNHFHQGSWHNDD